MAVIPALQSTPPVLPARPVAPGSGVSETPPLLSRGTGQEAPQPFREQRGFGVSGGTLVAAQEEAGKQRKAAEDAPKQDPGLSSDLSEADKDRVRELQARDREVRAHEQAHARVGGQHAGSPQYEFERGPDGRSYAVGGSVSISTAPVPGDPAATVRKMEQVKRAALAPSEPSGQDRRVAADADAKRADARSELNDIRREEMKAQFEGKDAPETLEVAKPETDANTSETPFGETADPSLPAGHPPTAVKEDNQKQLRNTENANAVSSVMSGFSNEDAVATGVESPGAPFAQQIESFSRTLERAIDAVSGFSGGVARLDIGQATQADIQTTTRRTGVDIRV